MKEQAAPLSPDALNALFAQLNPLDVEQFYTAYSLWSTRQRIQTLQALIDAIQRDIAENTDAMAEVHPSALALATLARLQANGVSDIALLDRMLEHGEEWLDRTMQHLEYCEKLDVISGNYTKWCENALEGAYDWIDSMLGQESEYTASAELPPVEMTMPAETGFVELEESGENNQPADEVMEELFLQKLMSDETEITSTIATTETFDTSDLTDRAKRVEEPEDEADPSSLLETTLKIRAIPQPAQQEPLVDTGTPDSELVILAAEQETGPEEVESTPVLAETETEHTAVTMLVVEQQEELPSNPQNIEAVHEQVEQPDIATEAQEPVIIAEPQKENEDEQEAVIVDMNCVAEPETSLELAESTGDEETPTIHGDSESGQSLQHEDITPAESVQESVHMQEPMYLRSSIPAMENAGIATNTNTASSTFPETETKPKRGFWRTLIAVLFHI